MESIISIVLPVFLSLVMFSVGLSLAARDFRQVWTYRRSLAVGVISMVVIVPVLAFVLVNKFSLSPSLAMGLMLVATCPGGTFSNLLSSYGKANLALSVSLTAVTSLLYIVMAPFLAGYFYQHFFGVDTSIDLPASQIAGPLIIFTIIPVVTGIITREKYAEFSERYGSRIKNVTAFLVAIIFILIAVGQGSVFLDNLKSIFIPMVLLNMLMFCVAMLTTGLTGVSGTDKTAIVVEHCVRQEGPAIYIAAGLLGNSAMATPLLVNSSIGLAVCSLYLILRKIISSAYRARASEPWKPELKS